MNSPLYDDPVEGHTSKAVDQALTRLRTDAVSLAGLVIDQVNRATRALLDGDANMALLVLSREEDVNEWSARVDQEAFQIIALHQPVAGDLRTVRAITRVAIDLERAGDEAKKIARFAGNLAAGEPSSAVTAVAKFLVHMAQLSAGMLRSSVRALDEANAELASQVAARDVELDREFAAALRQVLTVAMEGPEQLRGTIDTVFALKGLERIGDHAKNIAEQVLFMLGK